MAQLEFTDIDNQTVGITLDMIDMLVTVEEFTERHKSMPDSNPTKAYYKEMAIKLNDLLNENMHKLGLNDLYEVRTRLAFSTKHIIKQRQLAFDALQKLIDERV
jgi:hypothetical protein